MGHNCKSIDSTLFIWVRILLRSSLEIRNCWRKKRFFFFFFWVPSRRSENKEIINVFKIITYFQDTVSIHLIPLDPRCDIVMNWIWTVPIKFHSWIKILFFFFRLSEQGIYAIPRFELEERFQDIAHLFTLSTTDADPMYHKEFLFFWFYELEQK